jgi:hypothetical protein
MTAGNGLDSERDSSLMRARILFMMDFNASPDGYCQRGDDPDLRQLIERLLSARFPSWSR